MIVADAKGCRTYLEDIFGNKLSRYMGRLIKRYADYFWDYEKKYTRFSQKEYDRVVKLLEEYKDKVKGKDYKDIKNDLQMLLKYKARVEIYLHLKNK